MAEYKEGDEPITGQSGARERQTQMQEERSRRRSRGGRGKRRGHRAGISQMTSDVERLAHAWNRANIEVVFGVVEVVGDLLLDVVDSIHAQATTAEYDDDDEIESGRSRREREPRLRNVADELAADVSRAVKGAAAVLSDSAQNFSRMLDEGSESEIESPAHVNDDVKETGSTRRRSKTPSEPPSSNS